MPAFTAILWDLDGTLVDSAPGITASLAHTLATLGRPVPTDDELMEWVGPPILDSFRDLAGLDERESKHALRIYRRHYHAHGLFVGRVYPGVQEILRALRQEGVAMSTATSKPEDPARRILEHFRLLPYFDEITGASEDEHRSRKADVVLEALRRLREDGVDLSKPVMIGDRVHDVEGARLRGLPTIFVAWGYGSPAEQEGAWAVAESPEQLHELLGLW